jgi:hypothetical protein
VSGEIFRVYPHLPRSVLLEKSIELVYGKHPLSILRHRLTWSFLVTLGATVLDAPFAHPNLLNISSAAGRRQACLSCGRRRSGCA